MRVRRGQWAVLSVLVIGAAVLRFWRLGHQGFWYDEADTALLMHFRIGGMLGLIPKTESTPPLYYCLAWIWSRVFGDDEAGLRSLSALAGVLVVPAVYVAGARLTRSARVALAAAALAAFNPFLIWYSQEARAYELLVLFAAVSWVAFAGALDAQKGVCWLAAWVLIAALGLATHYYAVVVVGPQALVLLWRWRRRRVVWAAVGVVAAVGLALLPLLIAQNNRRNDIWISQISLSLRILEILPQFLIGTGTPHRALLKFACFLLVLAGLGGLAWLRPRRGLLLAGMTLGGFALSLLFVVGGSDTLLSRNLIGLWPGAAMTVATGLSAISAETAHGLRRWIAPALVAGLCLAGAVAAVGVATTYALQRPNWRPVAAILRSQPADGGRLILVQHYIYDLPLALYLPGLGFAREPSYSGVREVDVIAMRAEPGMPPCWWGAGCNLVPSELQTRYDLPGFHRVAVRRYEQFSVLSLAADSPQVVTRAEIAAALVTTTLGRDVLVYQRPPAA